MLIRARSHGIRASSYEGGGQNEASVFEAILVSQAAVKQTGIVGMYTATSMGPLPNRESV